MSEARCVSYNCYSCGRPTYEDEVEDYPPIEYEGKIFCGDDCIDDFVDQPSSYWAFDDDSLIDGVGFADPGGRSALRAETPSNPRNLPCPTCGRPSMLTPLDAQRGYQCDICADAAEQGFDY